MTTARTRTLRIATTALAAISLAALGTAPAHATSPLKPQEPFETTMPAGLACEFELAVAGTGGATATKTKDNVEITVGFGYALTFTNTETGATMSTRSKPFSLVTETVNGTDYVTAIGSHMIILFPSDVPAGPSTTIYNGRVTYTIDANEVWTITSSAGRTTDVCAELS